METYDSMRSILSPAPSDTPPLTVQEVVAMAAAGVKIDFDRVAQCIATQKFIDEQAQPGRFVSSEDEAANNWLVERMGWRPSRYSSPHHSHGVTSPISFQFVATHRLSPEKYVVIVSHKGEILTIEDDASLFPSDALVTKLRLMEG